MIPRAALLALIVAAPAAADTWTFDETTTGNDIAWTSPTSVDPNAPSYDVSLAITLAEATVEFSGIPFGPIDVLDQLPPEALGVMENVPGPAPISFAEQSIVVPEPPEPTTIALDIAFGLDAAGTGFFNATNVVLGTVMVDLGFPFGVVTADLIEVRVGGTVTVEESPWLDLRSALSGTNGLPTLTGEGPLTAGSALTLTLANALPNSTTAFFVGVTNISAGFKGGTLVPSPDLLLVGLPTGPTGTLPLGGTWPNGIPSGATLYFQHWVTDAGGPKGLAASNGLSGTAP